MNNNQDNYVSEKSFKEFMQIVYDQLNDIKKDMVVKYPSTAMIEGTAASPLGITILNSPNIKFELSKEENTITKGITLDDGTCIYDKPGNVTLDILPCLLSYNNYTVEIDLEDNATYGKIEVENDTVNIVDTDGTSTVTKV